MPQSHLVIEKLKFSPARALLFYRAHCGFELNLKLKFWLYTYFFLYLLTFTLYLCIDRILLMCPTVKVLNKNIEVLLCQYFRTSRYLLTQTNTFLSLKLQG